MAAQRAYEENMLLDSRFAPGGVIVYCADGGEEIIHANQYVFDLCECSSSEEFLELTGGTFRGLVHPDDLDAVEDSISGQVGEQDNLDHIYYRIRTRTGKVVNVEDYGRLVDDDGRGPVFTVFLVELRKGGSVDWLTGLPDMQRFHRLAQLGAGVLRARGDIPAVAALDLAGLKAYNAQYGWAEGDRLMRYFSEVLRTHFGSEACSRFAEDHFYAFSSAETIDQKLAAVFADFVELDDLKVLPIRTGVYACEPDDDVQSTALDRAKFACDLDRKTWQSHILWYSDEMRQAAQLRIHVLEYVDQAIEEGWIRPYYQAIVRASTGSICGEEALARWEDPRYGMLSPAQFVPVLEEAGLQYKVDMHMVECVLADFEVKRANGIPVVPVSVNISQRDLEGRNIVEEITRRADEANMPHWLLRIEFTESAASTNRAFFKSQVDALRGAGFEVWMDDFGSGYSTLNVVQEFDLDVIKLDMGFVSSLDTQKGRWILEGVVRSAERLGVNTLAEGVETEEQAVFLEEIGCGMLQGFHYVRPLPLEAIIVNCKEATEIPREAPEEQGYWDTVGLYSLKDVELDSGSQDMFGAPTSEIPVGVVELRNGVWRILRANAPYRDFLDAAGLLPKERSSLQVNPIEGALDVEFSRAAERSAASGAWERVAGRAEDGAGFQFYVKPAASAPRAEAFLVAAVPTMLGSALGSYGDVPVGYAIFRVVLNEAGDAVEDAEYVYANQMYCDWCGCIQSELVGRSFSEAAGFGSSEWFPYCYRAAVLGETVSDTIYSPEAAHWLSFNLAPSLVKDCCIFAFANADAERHERAEMEWAGTHDGLTELLDRRGIDRAVANHMETHPSEPFALALLDVDNFKLMNDLQGHAVGDEALRQLAQRMEQMLSRDVILGRNGGDEFLVLLWGPHMAAAQRLFESFTAESIVFSMDGTRYSFTVSIGYACYPEQASCLKDIYSMAYAALYSMKLSGKSGCKKFAETMKSQYRMQLGFTPRDIAENVPGAVMVHRAGGDGDILFANDELVEIFECDGLADFMELTSGTFAGIVHPDDRARVREEMGSQLEPDEVGGKNFANYRIVTKNGVVKHVADSGRLVELEGIGRVFYVLIIDLDERNLLE